MIAVVVVAFGTVSTAVLPSFSLFLSFSGTLPRPVRNKVIKWDDVCLVVVNITNFSEIVCIQINYCIQTSGQLLRPSHESFDGWAGGRCGFE